MGTSHQALYANSGGGYWAASSPVTQHSGLTAPANCRRRARFTNSTSVRNIKAAVSAHDCSGAARRSLGDQGLKGMVIWVLEDNDLAVSFYHGAGGRDVAEGVECFDGKMLKKRAFVWS